MYPNLLGQKAYYHLTDEDMGKIIGVSRTHVLGVPSINFANHLDNWAFR